MWSLNHRCLDVLVSVNIDNVCHLYNEWDLTWTIKSASLSSNKQIQGSKEGISCDVTFNPNDCVDIDVDYSFNHNNQPFDNEQEPLSTILFLYDNAPLFRYSPKNQYIDKNLNPKYKHNICLNQNNDHTHTTKLNQKNNHDNRIHSQLSTLPNLLNCFFHSLCFCCFALFCRRWCFSFFHFLFRFFTLCDALSLILLVIFLFVFFLFFSLFLTII